MTAGFDELFPKNHLFFVRHGYWAPTRGGPRDVFLLLRDGAGSRSRAALGDDEFWAVGSIWARGWKPFHGGAKALTVPRRFLGNGRSVSEKRFWSEPTRARARPGRSWPRRARGAVRRTRPRPRTLSRDNYEPLVNPEENDKILPSTRPALQRYRRHRPRRTTRARGMQRREPARPSSFAPATPGRRLAAARLGRVRGSNERSDTRKPAAARRR